MRTIAAKAGLGLVALLLPLTGGCASMIGNLDYAANRSSPSVPPPYEGTRMDAKAIADPGPYRVWGHLGLIDIVPSAALDTAIAPVTVPAWLIRGRPQPVTHGFSVMPGPC